jgi:hypothetical protein
MSKDAANRYGNGGINSKNDRGTIPRTWIGDEALIIRITGIDLLPDSLVPLLRVALG